MRKSKVEEFYDASKRACPSDRTIRFVLCPPNMVSLDLNGEMEGKELLVRASKKELEKMIRKVRKTYQCFFTEKNVVSTIDSILLQRIVSLIGLARKAGKIVVGKDKIKKELFYDRVDLLFKAWDSTKKDSKIEGFLKSNVCQVQCLKTNELSMPFGKYPVTYLGVMKSGFSSQLMQEASRLEHLRKRSKL